MRDEQEFADMYGTSTSIAGCERFSDPFVMGFREALERSFRPFRSCPQGIPENLISLTVELVIEIKHAAFDTKDVWR